MKRLDQLIEAGDLVFDIGANEGAKTDVLLRQGARVVCVEPQPKCVHILRKKYQNNPNVSVVEKGLADREGWMKLSICNAANTLSTFSENWKKGRFSQYQWDKTVDVEVTTLDRLIEIYGLPKYCKIDVEGFEFEVIRGLSKQIPFLSFEFTKEFIAIAEKIILYLQKIGYEKFNVVLSESNEFLLNNWTNPEELLHKLILHENDLLWGDIYAWMDTKFAVIKDLDATARLSAHLTFENSKDISLVTSATTKKDPLDWICQLGLWREGNSLRLHLGCGEQHLDGYVNIDNYAFVVFLVDDNIIVRKFHLSKFMDALRKQTDSIGFSLRLGKNTQYCYMLDRWQQLPDLKFISDGIFAFNWGEAECDFSYPLELSSSIYSVEEIMPLLKALNYENPNELEALLYENRYSFSTKKERLLCSYTSIAFSNPINKVQSVFASNRAGENPLYTTEKLFELFEKGYRIDVTELAGFVPNGCHQEV